MRLGVIAGALLLGSQLALWWDSGAIPGWTPAGLSLGLLSIALAAVGIWLRSRGLPIVLAVAAAALVAGVWRAEGAADIPTVPDELRGRETVEFQASLLTEAQPYGSLSRLPVEVERFLSPELDVDEPVRIDLLAHRLADTGGVDRSFFTFRHGDRYRVSGELEPAPTPDGIGRIWHPHIELIGEDAGSPFRRALSAFRSAAASHIHSATPEPAGGLVGALTVGDRSGLTSETREQFRASGIAHLLAISGLHVGIVTLGTLAAGAWLLGRRRQIYLAVPFFSVWGYAFIAGLSEPVTRAAIMASVYLLARLLGRPRNVLPALALAAGVMVALEPMVLQEVSFQLSFAAVGGIAVVGPRLSGWRLRERFESLPGLSRVGPAVVASLGVSLAATVATLPIVALNFEAVPIWGPITTLLALPAIPLAVGFGALTGLLGFISPVVSQVAAWLAWVAAEFVIQDAKVFSTLPPGPVEAESWPGWIFVPYYGLLSAFLARNEVAKLWGRASRAADQARGFLGGSVATAAPHVPRPVWAAGALVAAVVVTGAATAPASGRLAVTFFQTDRGDMILVETPNRRQILIDGGADPHGAVSALGEHLPFWDRSLDLVVLTHPHSDHIGGLLKVMERYEVSLVLDSPVAYDSDTYAIWLETAAHYGDRRVRAAQGSWIALDDGIALQVLSAGAPGSSEDANDSSVVLKLVHENVSFLFAADITAQAEAALLASGANLDADVLKVPHQGSRFSSSLPFLTAVSPAVSVFTVGTDNPFGHPHQEIVARIRQITPEAQVFFTAKQGDVTMTSDGERVWVERKR